jgi:hypothetical protein
MDKVSLNFSALANQNFTFKSFRKLRLPDDRKGMFPNVRSVKEYINNEIIYFWYSNEFIEGFEEIECSKVSPRSVVLLWLESELKKMNQTLEKDTYLKINRFNFKLYFIIKTHSEGNEVVGIEPYYLEQTKEYGLLIDFKFARLSNTKVQSIKELVLSLSLSSDFRANKNFNTDKYEKIKLFAQKYFNFFRSTPINFKKFTEFEAPKLSAKKYVFASTENSSQFQGLNNDSPVRKINEIVNLIFLYKEGEERAAREFLDKLKGEHKVDKTFKGFEAVFKSSIKVFPLKYTNNDPSIICSQIIEKRTQNMLVVIFQNDNISSLENNNFYYHIKNLLIDNNIPSQFVSYSIISKKFTIANIALQIFSKLGGIPWTVKPQNENCLIVGLAQIKHPFSDTEEGYYGYSVLLDSSGIYKEINALENGRPLKKEEYLKELGKSLVNIIKSNDNYKKIVIHAPFKERAEELSRIADEIKAISGEDKEIVLLRINSENKFYGYSLYANAYVPQEGAFLQISKNQFLIWFEGLVGDNAVSKTRYGGPTLIDFHYSNNELSFNDKKGYLQDVVNLSGANWRGFNAKSVPVSIYYCKILTKFISEFDNRNLKSINISSINPWFL